MCRRDSEVFPLFSEEATLLDKAIHLCMADSEVKAKKVKDTCRTCWVEQIDSYNAFLELLPAVHTCLQAMINPNQHEELGTQWSWDGETITKAIGFLYQLESSSFLILPHYSNADSAYPEGTYNEVSNANNKCCVCIQTGQVSSICIEKYEVRLSLRI